MSQEHKDLIRRYLNAFNERDRDAQSELLADDVVEHGIHDELHGPEEIIERLDAHFQAFPDYSGEAGSVVAEGDTVAVQYTAKGTHTGEYQNVEPTGHTVEWTGLAMYRVEDGQIAEIWIEEDRLGLLQQLELVEPPSHLRI
ncbi:MAG: DUF4440 domain-containing protein [Halobacteriales archaeon SW_9_67_25]|jgi:steroid delta-isomerase-like uncharacterized protein|nr:MAG: DUF4440 domain-containing protein [Halobacteriales archaeon SW_9_67_25]